jgi:glycosyltransferase involved in cell wall biosynthesis
MKSNKQPDQQERLKIAFFDYPDVFEDFYTHYGVDQQTFATVWHNTGSHAWIKIIQEEIGDVTWYVLSLKPALKEAKHEFTGCTMKFFPSSWLHRKCWHLFYRSSYSWRLRNYYRLYAHIASYLSLLSLPLIRELTRDKPDVILAQEYCSGRFDLLLLLAKIFRIPLVTYHAGSTADKYLGKFLKKITIPAADYIFPSGRQELDRLKNTYPILSERLSILRPPVDTAIYRIIPREIACRSVGLDPLRRYFIYLGRLDDSVKRISAIIRVFPQITRQFPNIDLLIIGAGKDEKQLKQEAQSIAPRRVYFIDWISSDEKKAQFLNAADCLVIASKREGFPTIIGEAFGCGLWVVSSSVGTISDLVITGETGCLFSPKDDEGLLRCLLWVAANPDKIKSKQALIRQYAEQQLSFEAIAKILKQGFSSVHYARS